MTKPSEATSEARCSFFDNHLHSSLDRSTPPGRFSEIGWGMEVNMRRFAVHCRGTYRRQCRHVLGTPTPFLVLIEIEIEKHRPLHQKPGTRLFVSSSSCRQGNGSISMGKSGVKRTESGELSSSVKNRRSSHVRARRSWRPDTRRHCGELA